MLCIKTGDIVRLENDNIGIVYYKGDNNEYPFTILDKSYTAKGNYNRVEKSDLDVKEIVDINTLKFNILSKSEKILDSILNSDAISAHSILEKCEDHEVEDLYLAAKKIIALIDFKRI